MDGDKVTFNDAESSIVDMSKKEESVSYKAVFVAVILTIVIAIISIILGIVLFTKFSSIGSQGNQYDVPAAPKWNPNITDPQEVLPQLQSLSRVMIRLIDALDLRDLSSNMETRTDICYIYKSPFGKIFCLSRNTKTFLDSRTFCREMHAQLATESIRNKDEREDVMKNLIKLINHEQTWIGLEMVTDGEWKYLDDVSATKDNTIWADGEPKNKNKCAYIWNQVYFQVHELACTDYNHALCELDEKKFQFY